MVRGILEVMVISNGTAESSVSITVTQLEFQGAVERANFKKNLKVVENIDGRTVHRTFTEY